MPDEKEPERFGPIFVITDRIDAVAAFYEDIVGLSVARRESGHHVRFRMGNVDLAVHGPEREVGPDHTPNERGTLIWFKSDRPLRELVALLEERRLTYWGPFDGKVRELLYALDPDGNMVGIYRPR